MARSLIAFIPVRGGSKGIPGKNLRPVGGRALVEWVVDAALGSASVDRVIVSTDATDIENHVRQSHPTVEIFRRSAATASDTASTESAMLEFVASEPELDGDILLLQATSPLTRSSDIEELAALLAGHDSALTAVRQKRFRWERGPSGARPVDFDPFARPRRQDYEGFLVENGAIYGTSVAALRRTGCRVSGQVGIHEMPEEAYVEIDEPSDMIIVDRLLRSRTTESDLQDRAGSVRLVITDVDGCLTDNGMYYGADGDELKRFSARDGKGFELLRLAGIQTMLLTSEQGPIIERRAEKLKVDHVGQGSEDKVADADAIRTQLGLAWREIAFLGDDVHDVALLERVGLSACPDDATVEATNAAFFRCPARGGRGAFRDLADLILGARL